MKYRMAPYGHTVFHDSMKYRMAIRYFMIPYFMIHHEIPYGHTVFHTVRVFHTVFHEIPYGHTVFHGIIKYRMAIRYFMES